MWQWFVHVVAVLLVLAGGFNWLAIGLGYSDIIPTLVGKYAAGVYLLVGIAAIYLFLQRSTWLPYLGWSVLPDSILIPSAPETANLTVQIEISPDAKKVVYWAANPSSRIASSAKEAYKNSTNAGVVVVSTPGVANLTFQCPGRYKVAGFPLDQHVHYREVFADNRVGPVQTQFLQC